MRWTCPSLVLFFLPAVLAADMTWTGTVTIAEERELPRGTVLTVASGTRVRFVGGGRLTGRDCRLTATGAVFSADGSLEGKSRIELRDTRGVTIRHCRFEGLVTVQKRFHDAAVSLFGGPQVFEHNRVVACSAIEWIRCAGPEAARNAFTDCTRGLVLFACRDGAVADNTFRKCRGDAITLNGTDGTLVVRNRMLGCGGGIKLYGSASDNTLSGNTVCDAGTAFSLWGAPARNLLLGNLVDGASLGLRGEGVGPGNAVVHAVFWGCSKAIMLQQIVPTGAVLVVKNSVIGKTRVGVNAVCDGVRLTHSVFWQTECAEQAPAGVRIVREGVRVVDPAFRNVDVSDFRLAPESPLLRAGDPAGTSIGLFP